MSSLGFNDAVEIILSHEGGYVNDPKDAGGETKYGISKRAYPHLDIKNITREQAKEIYFKDYWKAMKCDLLPFPVALSVFDFGVNSGNKTAIKALQRAVLVKDDGIIGPMTLAAVAAHTKQLVAEKIAQERILYYSSLKTYSVFGKGWVRRTIETLSVALLSKEYL